MTAPTPEQVKEAVEALTPWVEHFDTSATHHIRTILAALEESRKDSERLDFSLKNEVQFGVEFGCHGFEDEWIVYKKNRWDLPMGKGKTGREAIDAAIAAAAQAKGET